MIKFITDPQNFKTKALKWASLFEVCCYFDSNKFIDPYSKFDSLIACGVKDELLTDAGGAFDKLALFRKKNKGWVTGFLSYELKNEIENLTSSKIDHLEFPDIYFFVPENIIIITGSKIEILAENPEAVFEQIWQCLPDSPAINSIQPLNIQSRYSQTDYLQTVEHIKAHIKLGDIYVTNFCQEFFAENVVIEPLDVFFRLNKVSPNPYAAFVKRKHNYLLCASPERFLAKRKSKLISQPIKGTAKRGLDDAEDETIKFELRNNPKERQENVMVVDMVRNDLTRSAKQGSVKTEELYGIYSFAQVHQMVSTIVCDQDESITDVQAIKNSFPMGSMTGAPKVKAMHLMEQYEKSRRGVYSGAVGYFSPDGDFDFNVVIRSILYNQEKKYLSFQVGSAITYHAVAEKEYEECLLKAKAILEALGQLSITKN